MSYSMCSGPVSIIQEPIARALGDKEARVLFHLHYRISNENNHKVYSGRKYTYNTYDELLAPLYFLKRATLARIIKKLRDLGILITKKARHTWGYWYSINYKRLVEYLTNFHESIDSVFEISSELEMLVETDGELDYNQTSGLKNRPHITKINKSLLNKAKQEDRGYGGKDDLPEPELIDEHQSASERLVAYEEYVAVPQSKLPAFVKKTANKVKSVFARQKTKESRIVKYNPQMDALIEEIRRKVHHRLGREEIFGFIREYGVVKTLCAANVIYQRNPSKILNMGGFMRRAIQYGYHNEKTSYKTKMKGFNPNGKANNDAFQDLGYEKGDSYKNDTVERRLIMTQAEETVSILNKFDDRVREIKDLNNETANKLVNITYEDKVLLAEALHENQDELKVPKAMLNRGIEQLCSDGEMCGRVLLFVRMLKNCGIREGRLGEILNEM